MKDSPAIIETPLIGSGSNEEVIIRVNAILALGTSRGFLTYEELNDRLPDEIVSPDKLDSLLMTIDEMNIRLIDESDIGDFVKQPRPRRKKPEPAEVEPIVDDQGEVLDMNLDAELAEASTKRIDDPVRMYLTQMGEIPLLTRPEEIYLAKKIEITRKIFRSKVLESDYCLSSAAEILQQVDDGALPFDRTMKISTAEDQADKGTIGERIPTKSDERARHAAAQPRRLGVAAQRQVHAEAAGGRADARHSSSATPQRKASGGALAANEQGCAADEKAGVDQQQDGRA